MPKPCILKPKPQTQLLTPSTWSCKPFQVPGPYPVEVFEAAETVRREAAAAAAASGGVLVLKRRDSQTKVLTSYDKYI